MKSIIDQNQIRLARDKADALIFPASSITEISFGQDAHRRVGAAIGLAVFSLGHRRSYGTYQLEETLYWFNVG